MTNVRHDIPFRGSRKLSAGLPPSSFSLLLKMDARLRMSGRMMPDEVLWNMLIGKSPLAPLLSKWGMALRA
jgi:hypothetical protein